MAWSFTDGRQPPPAQTGQLAVYLPGTTEKTAIAYNLSKLNIVYAKGAIVTSAPEKPSQPAADPAVPKAFKAAANGYSSVKLSWKPVGKADGYCIYRYNPKTKAYSRLKNLSAGTAVFTDKNLDVNTTCRYKISAYCEEGGIRSESALSAAVLAKPVLDKPVLTKLRKKGKSAVIVKWKAVAGANGYQVYRAAGKARCVRF